MQTVRTPDDRFDDLPDFPYEPRYSEIPDGDGGTLRVAWISDGPQDGDPVLMLHGEPSWSYLYRKMIPILADAGHRVICPDLVGFGRRHLAVGHDELVADVVYQVGALEAFCRRHGTAVSYIKAHGALYNDLADDAELAGAFGDAIRAYGGDLAVLTLAGSRSVDVLRGAGLPVLREGFADRAYTPDGRLVPRRLPGAVVADPAVVADRGRRIATGEPIADCEGGELVLEVDSLCVHGDTPGALELAVALRRALDDAGVAVARSR